MTAVDTLNLGRESFRRLLNRYFSRLLRAAHHDPVVANAYLRLIAMVTPPQQILHPRIAWRVLRHHRKRAQTRRHADPGRGNDPRQRASATDG